MGDKPECELCESGTLKGEHCLTGCKKQQQLMLEPCLEYFIPGWLGDILLSFSGYGRCPKLAGAARASGWRALSPSICYPHFENYGLIGLHGK